MSSFKEKRVIEEYHAHVYFQESTRQSAESLHERLIRGFGSRVKVYAIAYGPRGPHVQNMFGVDIPKTAFEEVLEFLIIHHGPHSVLIHPVTDNELLDHTHHALWLGMQQALNLECLV